MATVGWVGARVVLVAPARLFQFAPLSLLTCHCTVGAGLPLAAATNDAFCPCVMDCDVGWVVTVGALQVFTVCDTRRAATPDVPVLPPVPL